MALVKPEAEQVFADERLLIRSGTPSHSQSEQRYNALGRQHEWPFAPCHLYCDEFKDTVIRVNFRPRHESQGA